MAPPDPPDPPEYGPTRPPRGREDTGVGRIKTSSADSIQATVDEVLRRLTNRDEQSDVRRIDERSLAAEFQEWKRDQAESERRAEARRRLAIKVGTAFGILAGIAAAAWRTFEAVYPQPPAPPRVETADVQETVEERTADLEQQLEVTNAQVTELQLQLKAARDELARTRALSVDVADYLGQKIDAISPKASHVPRPATFPKPKPKPEPKPP